MVKNLECEILRLRDRRKRLRGIVREVIKTGEKKVDDEGNVWEKCIFVVELIGFSKRTPEEALPEFLNGVKVKVTRWCCLDWHYKIGVPTTLTPEETEKVLKGTLNLTSQD